MDKIHAFDALRRHNRVEVRNNASQLLASKSYQDDLAGNITQTTN
ncbi:hypothetical protein [Acidovorax sp. Leaf84]|nr:hypothetical protein [Acidovorax sp. Leaf84]